MKQPFDYIPGNAHRLACALNSFANEHQEQRDDSQGVRDVGRMGVSTDAERCSAS